jgi:hypothetical protein
MYNRAHTNTGLDLGEGLGFAAILILWMASLMAIFVLAGA